MKMRRRKTERGQAIAELVAGLIGISFVVLGILAMSMLGISGIKNLISARKGAEENMAWNMAGGNGGQHITEWRNVRQGEGDGIQFTRDDEAFASGTPDSTLFMDNLKDNTGTFSTALLLNTNYADGAFDDKIEMSNLFVSAAGLTSARLTDSNPLGKYQFFDLQRIMNSFGIKGNFTVDDTVFLPVRGGNSN